MARANAFTPDWVSPPGDTISDILDEKKIATSDFAEQMRFSDQQAINLLSGRMKITKNIAKQLQNTIGPSSSFWVKRELFFQERLKKQQRSNNTLNAAKWLTELPLSELIRFGWVEKKSTTSQQVNACLSFFGVSDVDSWCKKYEDVLGEALFRTSPTFVSH